MTVAPPLKTDNQEIQFRKNHAEIKEWLAENCIITGEYRINADNQVEVNGSVRIRKASRDLLKRFEVAFATVSSDFSCSSCYLLETLAGAPQTVGGNFSCEECYCLTDLRGAPHVVGGDVHLTRCRLNNLHGLPSPIGGNLWCTECMNLKTLSGIGQIQGRVVFEHLQEPPTAEMVRTILHHRLYLHETTYEEMYGYNRRAIPEYNDKWLDIVNDYYDSGDLLTAITEFEELYNEPFHNGSSPSLPVPDIPGL